VLVEKVFRGRKYEKPVLIESASYKTDYRLLSKKEEQDYCQVLEVHSNSKILIAPFIDVPPLLRELFRKETGKEDIKMKTAILNRSNKKHRVAKEGEKPDLEPTIDLRNPVSPSLFEGCNMKNL
jgi:Mitochondrial 28S ribosomal protein S34